MGIKVKINASAGAGGAPAVLTPPISDHVVHFPIPAAEGAVSQARAGARGYAPHSGSASVTVRSPRPEGTLRGRVLDQGAAGAIAAVRLLGLSSEAALGAPRSHATVL